jgi:hypothetical protein
LVVQINKQNGGLNEDGLQALIFYSQVNFYANQLKLGIWKERLHFKIGKEMTV